MDRRFPTAHAVGHSLSPRSGLPGPQRGGVGHATPNAWRVSGRALLGGQQQTGRLAFAQD
jgi:hypothetical protein